jgi:alpha-N-arabinofuranosidase
MKSLQLALGSLVCALGWACPELPRQKPADSGPAVGQISVHPEQALGDISPLIFGAGVEWTEDGNRILDPKTGRMRADALELLRPLHIPVWRFPGGILADYYHWKDGVGPRAQREKRENPMDGSVQENSFGTDEFIEFCRAQGSEALITANFGTGSLDEVLAWQQYFQDKKFPIRYWEIGNEIYLAEPKRPAPIPGNDQRIYKTPAEYAAGFVQWARALRAKDKGALIGAIAGTDNTGSKNRKWLDVVLSEAASDADFIALHNAFAPLIFDKYDYADAGQRGDAYRAMLAQPSFMAEDTRKVEKALEHARPNAPARIAITEHFPLFGGGAGGQEQLLAVLDQSRSLAAALYTGSLFHGFMREGVWMANYNLATSKWFGALLTDSDKGWVKTPTYHLYDLYINHFGTKLVHVEVKGPRYSSRKVGSVPARNEVEYLDAVASVDKANSVYLAVINRSLEKAVESTLEVAGLPKDARAEVRTLSAASANSINGTALSKSVVAGSPDAIVPKLSRWAPAGADSKYSFPPCSVTVFAWKKP